MDFDVMKCACVIQPIILSEGIKGALIAHVEDLRCFTVIY